MEEDITKTTITVSISDDVLDWIDHEIRIKRRFGNRSHALEFCAMSLKMKEGNGDVESGS